MRRSLLSFAGFAVAACLVASMAVSCGSDGEGARATDFEVGNLDGTVYWNGAPISSDWLSYTNTASRLQVRPEGSSTVVAINTVDLAGTYSVSNLPVGTYVATVYFGGGFQQAILGSG